MANIEPYADLEIRILALQEAGYPVELTLNPGQYYRRGYSSSTLPPWEDAPPAGARLFAWLFEDPALKAAWDYARGQHPRRRIRLRLDADVPELHALPWESLRDPTGLDLAGADATPFSRFLAGEWPAGSVVRAHSLKLLVAIADPGNLRDYGLAAINAEAEWEALQAATAGLDVQLTPLPSPCTLNALDEELRRGYPVLHLIAHGKYDRRQRQALLYLADADNRVAPVTEIELASMLQRWLADSGAALRLVFLASCEGASHDTTDAFRGLAPALVKAGVPAIVAMQERISLAAARQFSCDFYRHLFQHGLVDLAGNQARAALLTARSSEAATPVLLMRLPDGKLWDPPVRRDCYAHAPRLEPERYIQRPHEYDRIKALLLAGTATVGITTALWGTGGFGKTTLARTLCDDADIQARFSDGILWATVGETPDLPARLREWVTALGGVISENAPTIPQLVNRLTDLLRDGAFLLVIDDVWDSAALTPFLCGGPRCAHLVTTRHRTTLPAGVQLVNVDTMCPAEAVALLGYGLGPATDTPEAASLPALARRLGHWPLLLGIINGVLRELVAQGASLTGALAQVAAGLTAEGLTAFDAAAATDRARAVRVTLELSLNHLSPTNRARYTELAIFPEDTTIPATAAARLWGQTGGLSAFQTQELFRRLAGASLVQTYDAGRQTVRLHDVVRQYLADALGPAGRAAAQRALLTAYRQTQTGTGWHTAPDDGYLYAHLAYHLHALADTGAGAAAELAALFADDGWLHARVPADGYTYDGYLADLDLAWQRAEAEARQQMAANAPPDALADCIRYALIRTTVNSLASNYMPKLVARAVAVGLWPAARALSVAAKIPEAKQRAKMYTLLLRLEVLTADERQAAQTGGLAAVQATGDEADRAQALVALAPQLTGELLTAGLALTRAIRDESRRAEMLIALAPRLTGEGLTEGLALALGMRYGGRRAQILVALAPPLSGELLAKALAAARQLQDEAARSEALAALAAALEDEAQANALLPVLVGAKRESLLAESLAAARAIRDSYDRAMRLAALADQLRGEAREQVLAEGIQAVRAINWPEAWAEAVAVWAPQLTETERETWLAQGLEIASGIKDEKKRTRVLMALSPRLSGALLATGLAVAKSIQNEWQRAQALAALAPRLSGELLAKGRALALAIEDPQFRTYALAALAPRLDATERTAVLQAGLAAVSDIKNDTAQTWALAVLAGQLTGELLAGQLAVAQVGDEQDCGPALAALERARTTQPVAPPARKRWGARAPGRAVAKELAQARSAQEAWLKAQRLVALAPQLKGAALTEALAMVPTIEEEQQQARVLAALAPQLTEDSLAAGLKLARALQDEGARMCALAALLHFSSDPQAQAARQEYQELVCVALRAAEQHQRAAVLQFLAGDAFCPAALGLTPAAVERLATAVAEICRRWEWL